MKLISLFSIAIICVTTHQLQAQSNSILKVHRVNYELAKTDPLIHQQVFSHAPIKHERAPGESAHRSGMALIILGPIKMAVGLVGVGLCVAGALSGSASGGMVVIGGVVGGFHLVTGAAVTGSGVFLLKKAKRQREQNSTRVYMSIPNVNIRSVSGTNPALGLGTTLTF